MRPDEIDRILSKRDEIVPSSGFVASVMNAVRREAEAPPAIEFRWVRALPALLGATAILGILFGASVRFLFQGNENGFIPQSALSDFGWVFDPSKAFGAGWIALALILSAVSVKLSAWLTSKT